MADRHLKRYTLFILGLFALALLLRLQGWFQFTVPDEDVLNGMAWQLRQNPVPAGMPILPGYPPMFPYLNFLLTFFYQHLLLFFGIIDQPSQFLFSEWGWSFTMIAGRALVALLGALQVWVVWRIGHRFFSPAAGLGAAFLIAVNPNLVFNSHIFKSDIPLAFFLTVSLYFLLAFLENPLVLRNLFFFAFFLGLATAAKFNGAVEVCLIIPLFWMIRRQWSGWMWGKGFAVLLGGGLSGFLILAPNWALHPLVMVRETVSYLSQMYSYVLYDRAPHSYLRYITDFIHSFGFFFMILFVLGMALAWFRKNRQAQLLIWFFSIYFLAQGKSSFFGNRMVLPLYTAMALIIAWVAVDGWGFPRMRFPGWKKWTLGVSGAMLIWVGAGQFAENVKTFTLLKTTSQLEAALDYRRSHLAGPFNWARENFTPVMAGDAGIGDLTALPLTRFRSSIPFDFLSTGLLSEDLLFTSKNVGLRKAVRERLHDYRMFHRIHKNRFSPWDSDILFWYRPHPDLRRAIPAPESAPFPPVFSRQRDEAGTVFLPIQPYEKNQCWTDLSNRYYGRWLASSRKIESVRFYAFSATDPWVLETRLSGHKRTFRGTAGKVCDLGAVIPGSPLAFHDDPLYSLEIRPLGGNAEIQVVYFPRFAGEQAPAPLPKISGSAEIFAPIPPLFSSQSLPDWLRRFHRQTGIDLALLTRVNRQPLNENPDLSLDPLDSGFFPVSPGIFRLEVEWDPVAGPNPSAVIPVRLQIAGLEQIEVRKIDWNPRQDKGIRLDIERSSAPVVFVRVQIVTSPSSGIITRIVLVPDYRAMVSQL